MELSCRAYRSEAEGLIANKAFSIEPRWWLEGKLEKLKLQEVLRYAFSGALFYIALGLIYLTKEKLSLGAVSAGHVTLGIGLVLLTGSLLYTTHRALTYPFVFFPLALSILSTFGLYEWEWRIVIPFLESNAELKVDNRRLQLRNDRGKKGEVVASMFDEWGAQVHFLYCSSLAVGLALCARIHWSPCNAVAWSTLLWVALVFLISAFSHHLRLLIRIATLRLDCE